MDTATTSTAPRAFPRGMQSAGRLVARLLARGVPLGPLSLLETRGRRSGVPHPIPVAVLHAAGQQWLVSPFGEVDWVRNARVDGHATLARGRRGRSVRLVELADDRRADLVRRYRRRFALVPFVRAAFAPDRGGPAVDDRPVFEVRAA